MRLQNGRASKEQVYPDALCRATCQGVQDQIEVDKGGQFMLMNITNEDKTTSRELKKEENMVRSKYKIVEEDDSVELECAWDDVSGAALDPQKVRKARQEEIEYVHKMSL